METEFRIASSADLETLVSFARAFYAHERVAEDACRELGIRALHLEVERSNTAAQEFYRAHGFIDHDRYFMTKDV